MDPVKRTCAYCNKTLQPIGNYRQNGSNYMTDYDTRKLHRKCNNFIKGMARSKELYEQYLRENQ
jgi:hypothetical protein